MAEHHVLKHHHNTDFLVEVAPGVKLHVNDYGTGKPVILIHGWPYTAAMWEYNIDALIAAGFRVIAYDRRGFGCSSKPWNGYDYDTLADDLKAIIEELKLTHVTLVGFSMGGGEVARYFSRHGGKHVVKAALISSICPYMLKTEANKNGVDQKVFDDILKSLANDRIAFLDSFGKDFFGVTPISHPISGPLLEHFNCMGAVAMPRATIECVKAFSTTDFRGEISAINVPTLIIHGDSDRTVPIAATSEEAAKKIANNKYLVYKSAPHGLFYTEREKFNVDLVNFLKE